MKFKRNDVILHQNELQKDNPTFWVIWYAQHFVDGNISYECHRLDNQNVTKSISGNPNVWISAQASHVLQRFAEFLI